MPNLRQPNKTLLFAIVWVAILLPSTNITAQQPAGPDANCSDTNPQKTTALQKNQNSIFNVCDFGAVGNGKTLNTKAIQAAIDAANKAGGGKVYFARGKFLSGALFLKSNVTLYLDKGAVLLGSPNPEDYPASLLSYESYFSEHYGHRGLITAEKQENIAIIGSGLIDGQGWSPQFKALLKEDREEARRPMIIRFSECKNVTVKGIGLTRSACWLQCYVACDNVLIDGIKVDNVGHTNTDGLNFDNSTNIRVSNCRVVSRDDALCFKSSSAKDKVKNVTVTNCILSSRCNAIKFGTDSRGGFENITISNCLIFDSRGAIAVEMVDGGTIDRINISNIAMLDVKGPIFLRLGNRDRGQEKPTPGTLKNVTISNIQAKVIDSVVGCPIAGLPGHPIENVTLENINIEFAGGGKAEDITRDVPEYPDRYPEFFMFAQGVSWWDRLYCGLPAYGFWIRHAKNITLDDVHVRFRGNDARPAVFCDDVQDLTISNIDGQLDPSTEALIWLKDVDGAFIHSSRPSGNINAFVKAENSKDITIINNDLAKAKKVLVKGKGLKDDAVYISGNRTK